MSDKVVPGNDIALAAALRMIADVVVGAEGQGLAVSVAVVDRAGNVVASGRMPGAALGTMRFATDKAYTSAIWQYPSGAFRESSQPGGDDWGLTSTESGRIVVYDGGLPIHVAGKFVGAIGVSGGTGEQDAAMAAAARGVEFGV
ncbi:MAG: heme-binding protein [Actinomycetes bacterium]